MDLDAFLTANLNDFPKSLIAKICKLNHKIVPGKP